MDNKLQGARDRYWYSGMKPEFYNKFVTLDPTINVSVCDLLLWRIWEEGLRSNLLDQKLSEYWQPKPVLLGQVTVSIFVFSYCLIKGYENYSCSDLDHVHLLSNYRVPGSMLSEHGESSGNWCSRM